MEKHLKNWSFTRIFHLIAAIGVLIAAYLIDNNIFLYILGFGFLFQAITKTGCSDNSCDRTYIRKKYGRRH